MDPDGLFGLPGAVAGGVIGGISGGFGAAATGGNVLRGAVLGAIGGAVVGGSGAWIAGLPATIALRSGAGLLGNVIGQGQNIGEPNFTGFNVGSMAGAAVGGALGACVAPGAYGTQFAGSTGSQVLQRALAGLPAAAVAGTFTVVGTFVGNPTPP